MTKPKRVRKPLKLRVSDDDDGCGGVWTETGMSFGAGPKAFFWGDRLTSLSSKECRRLAAWLTKAAEWLEYKEQGEK